MRESRTSGSVRGAAREGGSYRDTFKVLRPLTPPQPQNSEYETLNPELGTLN